MLISGGMVADGSGGPLFAADVLVADGVVAEIAATGTLHSEFALVLDAAGQVVCPGFIDVHSHADNAPLLDIDDLSKIQQGVTTEVVGNCGFSLAPVGA
ncbi:MAG: amidohydrolase family protein, partial [Candidatus Dormibacteraeota bacterium]|nr:amidohydrolase family protein [Candidatus Dormibacteraeota bacterium]